MIWKSFTPKFVSATKETKNISADKILHNTEINHFFHNEKEKV